ncbi:MAG: glycosyltransferase family 4 protein [Clostridia bacterium]|jgi:cell shape-determining protein MreC|nr:glycosyltransferase family 4 protein [Clostridia bacterium]
MKIGIDGRGLEGKKSGIGIYIEEVIKQINNIEDQENQYIIYSPRKVEINAKLKKHIIIKDGNKRLRKLLAIPKTSKNP